MTTPIPQDIEINMDIGALAGKIAADILWHQDYVLTQSSIAAALAAERSRWQAECERLREALEEWHAARKSLFAFQPLAPASARLAAAEARLCALARPAPAAERK